MALLGRWPNLTPLFDGKSIAPSWQRWFTALVEAVTAQQSHFQFGSGDPEGVVEAAQGTVFVRDNGAAGSTVYSKTTGGTDPATLTKTGWVALS